MKYAIRLDNGRKAITLASDDIITIDITTGNRRTYALTLRDGVLYDQDDNEVHTASNNPR